MKNTKTLLSILMIVGMFKTQAQSTFTKTDYENFLKQNKSMTYSDAAAEYPLPQSYYKNNSPVDLYKYNYFDSLEIKYKITQGEKDLIQKNGFMVSERLSYKTFEEAFSNIFYKDMPVFLSTDAILFALHTSYDNILKEVEVSVMEPNIKNALNSLYTNFPKIKAKYQSNPELKASLADVDLYVTVANSLINGYSTAQDTNTTAINLILKDVYNEKFIENMHLFVGGRNIDFSQFTPRGHYLDKIDYTGKTLKEYFRTMIWLGRIDFWLTNPDTSIWTKQEIKRMNYDALLLNELFETSGAKKYIDENDGIITFLINQCDNVTPAMLSELKTKLNIQNATSIIDSLNYNKWYNELNSNPKYDQQILSDGFDTSAVLPVSYRLLGQRYIVDSYSLAVVVNKNVTTPSGYPRLMPKTMDALFTLGNNNALPMVKSELSTYQYAQYLVTLRKLIDGNDSAFWAQSQYNTWLQAIRDLNPNNDTTKLPFFMTTAGWQHEKMNTQLASWAQLRHDNILYTKQSYTPMAGCSYPYSYVEPYPQMYNHIKQFAQKGGLFFAQYSSASNIQKYFTRMATLMDTLETISIKELQHDCLSTEELDFLKKMIKSKILHGCFDFEVISGWYSELLYNYKDIIQETVIADVHTQPADAAGNIVGNVLHVATGKVNLGVFMANAPLPDGRMMAFVGPVMSYYEKITDNFKRLTDQEWRDSVAANVVPARPDWTNIYLANKSGNTLSAGAELPSKFKAWNDSTITIVPQIKGNDNITIAPNPTHSSAVLFTQFPAETMVNITILDMNGRIVSELKNQKVLAGTQQLQLPTAQLAKGVYFCSVVYGNSKQTFKLIKN